LRKSGKTSNIKTAEIWEKNCGKSGKKTAEIWEKTAEIWEKFKYKNCGNLGKKSISIVRKYGKKMRKYGNLRLFICRILATYRFFSICANMGKCCGIVVFSRGSASQIFATRYKISHVKKYYLKLKNKIVNFL
jgi:hypothetical protein